MGYIHGFGFSTLYQEMKSCHTISVLILLYFHLIYLYNELIWLYLVLIKFENCKKTKLDRKSKSKRKDKKY